MRTFSRRSFLGTAAVISLTGGVTAVLAQSTSDPKASPEASPGASPVASPMASPMATPMAGPAAGGETVAIDMLDTFRFEPAELEVKIGTTLHLENKGYLEHDFAVDEWGGVLTEYLLAGQTADVVVPDDAEVGKTYEFYCSVAGHKQAGMLGKLTVID